ncbi:preprotein translocase subunit TatC [Sphingomonas sp. IBVSS1]|nr:preprotein translocase subunit TatC [Sphingomonas sp. IBVSS1]
MIGLDDAMLQQLVDGFYARVRADSELGPLFNGAVADWPQHLQLLGAFWSSVMLTSGRYKGQPLPAHLKHRAAITPAMFRRWLTLWQAESDARLAPDAAAAVQARAERIARSLQLALFPPFPTRSVQP